MCAHAHAHPVPPLPPAEAPEPHLPEERQPAGAPRTLAGGVREAPRLPPPGLAVPEHPQVSAGEDPGLSPPSPSGGPAGLSERLSLQGGPGVEHRVAGGEAGVQGHVPRIGPVRLLMPEQPRGPNQGLKGELPLPLPLHTGALSPPAHMHGHLSSLLTHMPVILCIHTGAITSPVHMCMVSSRPALHMHMTCHLPSHIQGHHSSALTRVHGELLSQLPARVCH